MSDGRRVVLLVEDNEDHAELVMRGLAEQNTPSDVHHVTDGEAALDYLFHRGRFTEPALSPRPHLVVLDLRLPKLDGLGVLRAVKESPELRALPVVVLTSSEAESDRLAAYARHANSYLVKPAHFGRLGGLLRRMGAYWLSCNRPPWP